MKSRYTRLIKEEAGRLGFDFCGISKAEFLEEEAPRLEQWLKKNMHGQMGYMARNFDKRLDPRLLVEGAKSVISLLLNYSPPHTQPSGTYRISKYAYGKDYHLVIKEKLKILLANLRSHIGDVHGRAFTDSAPVMDKAWAKKAGLGWIGKNANLINQKAGSLYFIAELIVDVELEYDQPVADHCGTCTRCIDACPTDAIVAPYVVDGSKCISYLTIELKDNIPQEFKGKWDDWIFGCDVCQEVCPWNRFSSPHHEDKFVPSSGLFGMTRHQWEEITEETFGEVFKDSAVMRTGFKGLKRNIDFLGNFTSKQLPL